MYLNVLDSKNYICLVSAKIQRKPMYPIRTSPRSRINIHTKLGSNHLELANLWTHIWTTQDLCLPQCRRCVLSFSDYVLQGNNPAWHTTILCQNSTIRHLNVLDMQRGEKHGEDASASEAFQFSFFGDLSAVDGDLGGALEEGLDAPPEEEGLVDGLEEEEETEDLSYASMFANLLGKGDGVLEDTDDDPLVGLLTEQPGNGLSSSTIEEITHSNAFSTGSIALGGLLTASVPTHDQPAGFGMSRGVLEMPFPSPPQQLIQPHSGGSVLTAHDLEAQLRAGVHQGPSQLVAPQVAQQQKGVFTPEMIMQQQQQQQAPPRPPQPPPMMQSPIMTHQGPPQGPPGGLPGGPPRPPQGPWQVRPPPPPVAQMHPAQNNGMPPAANLSSNLAQRLKALNLAEKTSPVKKMATKRMSSSWCMTREEIDSILFMQSKALHMAPPYLEDYYYQAFLDKYYDNKNSETFAPESVRELAPTEKVASESVAFVKLDGLGRVAFSNIRRPRPLMDLSVDAKVDGSDGDNPQVKRLDQEPALAARIMIEDCMALILDVQDVDRIFIASGGVGIENEDALKQRRVLLVEGLASSLRISETPQGDSDGVFLRLMGRNKGRILATRSLKIVYPPKQMKGVEPNFRILWALMRQLATIFRSNTIKPTDRETIDTLSALAKSLMDIMSKISSPHALGDAIVAMTHGPLFGDVTSFFAPGQGPSDTDRKPWMCDVIAALLSRGAEIGLHNTVSDSKHSNSWSSAIQSIFQELEAYLRGCKTAKDAKKSIPVPLIGQQFMIHFTQKQKDAIQTLLLDMGV